MKKAALFIALFAFSSVAHGQTIGLRTGINIASQLWNVEGSKIRPASHLGPHLGLTLNFSESEKASAQLEVSYSRFGFGKYTDSTGTIPPQSIDYIKFGGGAKYYLKEKINIHAGAELGFGFRDARDLIYLSEPDFGLFVGCEYYYNLNLGIGGRYFYGISDTNDIANIKQFNRAFQISVLIRFNGLQLKQMGH